MHATVRACRFVECLTTRFNVDRSRWRHLFQGFVKNLLRRKLNFGTESQHEICSMTGRKGFTSFDNLAPTILNDQSLTANAFQDRVVFLFQSR